MMRLLQSNLLGSFLEHLLHVAKQINTTVTTSYWEIGKLLTELKVDSKYSDLYVKRLSIDLKKFYPNMGGGISEKFMEHETLLSSLYQEDKKVQPACGYPSLLYFQCGRTNRASLQFAILPFLRTFAPSH